MRKENGTVEHTCHMGHMAVNITITFTLSAVCLCETPALWSENFTFCLVIHQLIHICSSVVLVGTDLRLLSSWTFLGVNG